MGIVINFLDEFYKDCGFIMDFRNDNTMSHRINEKCGLKKMSK